MCIKNKSLKKKLAYIKNEFETLTLDHAKIKKELEIVLNEKNLVIKELDSTKNETKDLKQSCLV